jgi:hypothetical protein
VIAPWNLIATFASAARSFAALVHEIPRDRWDGAGIRLHTYLPTRMFELAVHGLDIARAVGVSFALPADVLEETTALAARIAVAEGHGETVLLALTGRAGLPSSFSAV